MGATIINNDATALQSDVLAPSPYIYVPDPTKAKPLAEAQLYFGIAGRDPEVVENQKKVYILNEDGSAVAIDQPVRTGAGGVPMYNNTPAALAVDGTFSYKVLDKNGAQVYYAPKVTTPNLLGYSGVVLEEAKTYVGISTLTFDVIEASTAAFYVATSSGVSTFNGRFMQRDVDYAVVSSSQIILLTSYASGTVILGRQMDPSGEVVPVAGSVSSVIAISTINSAKAVDLKIGDTVTINGGTVLGDGLGGDKYICVAAATGTADDENFIDLNNGNQLQLVQSNKVMRKYAQKQFTASIASNSITIDFKNGTEFLVTLNDNVTGFAFLNINQLASTTSDFTLKVKQSAGTLYDITWPATFKWAGGVAPTVTQTINREDVFGFKTYNGGATWYAAVMGQDYAV